MLEQASQRPVFRAPEVGLPSVSVIVTCFNYGRYVIDALDSVITQTYQNFECVIVDDASTDDSAIRVERWLGEHQDPRFRLIRNPSNRGQTGGFAVGLSETSGEFVAFLDADDFWFPEFLQRHLEAHLNRVSFASLSGSGMVQIDEERTILAATVAWPTFQERRSNIEAEKLARIDTEAASLSFCDPPTVEYIRPAYDEILWTGTSGLVFRRSTLDLVMPKNPDELRICTDWYIFLICNYFTGSLSIGAALGAYRRHGKNNFASNPVMGLNNTSAPLAAMRHHKVVIDVMLRHLIDQYDRFATVFPVSDVRRLIRILFAKALREKISVEDPRLRNIIGIGDILRIRTRVGLSFLRPLLRVLKIR
jgi:glycosyltransferase involved in cell wall biosynthesis